MLFLTDLRLPNSWHYMNLSEAFVPLLCLGAVWPLSEATSSPARLTRCPHRPSGVASSTAG